jgi:hypothetical protein
MMEPKKGSLGEGDPCRAFSLAGVFHYYYQKPAPNPTLSALLIIGSQSR